MPNAHDPERRRPGPPDAAPASDPSQAPKAPVDIAEESVAGEEDPGASLDVIGGDPAPSPTPGKEKPVPVKRSG